MAVASSSLEPARAAAPNGSATNGPAVYSRVAAYTNASLRLIPETLQFDHFQPNSLNQLIWTNWVARTNGRDMQMWALRTHPQDWPQTPPQLAWNEHSLLFGMNGFTALSPCWSDEGSSGQAPVTALTRRHGFTRGHSMGADGVTTNRNGKKVWFLTASNQLVEVRVSLAIIRIGPVSQRDYTILLFDRDLPPTIQPMRVGVYADLLRRYTNAPGAPWPMFKTEQGGYVSTEVPPFAVDTWKAGDSGSPNMLPLPGELLFLSGRSCSGPSPQMQTDMNLLCRIQGLNPDRYQLQWYDLKRFPEF